MRITITGASDDLIEIDGDIQEEWNILGEVSDRGAAIAVSDGTLLSVQYDKHGIWRFARLISSGQCAYSKVEGDVRKDTFDIVTLDGPIEWIAMVSQYIIQ